MIEPDTFDASIITLKILSCIYRVKGRAGASQVSSILRGSSSKKIKESGFDKLTTFGIVKDFNEKQIVVIIHYLMYLGLLKRSFRYKTLILTEKGRRFLEEKPVLNLPATLLPQQPSPSNLKTLALWQQGLTLQTISQQRNLAPSTIENHIADLIRSHKITDISKLVSPRDLELINNTLDQSNGVGLKDIKSQLPAYISYGQIKIALAMKQ